ncbi:hypothetical protein [Reichenbachiella ulvae]|uniref:Mercuric ion transport protein n=1 Tax=Reichenbachiella ulvae TaxID=2980104 RepID=A0ABT3D078_9BACT|nr:hypothetical protein [Reichenbachiella ulvae]MCV9389367.1 hypothetical protein [Reichenbachiella ulvae]
MFKKFAWAGIGLCGLCCALPLIGIITGIGSLTAFGMMAEKIGIVALGVSGVLFAIHHYRKKHQAGTCGPSCDIDCTCKTGTNA